jgi:hypothetical protein
MKEIENAIQIAFRFGDIDGAHHKMWVIDQMVRALCGCESETGDHYTENENYLEFVRLAKDGEDGPDSYTWETGIAP